MERISLSLRTKNKNVIHQPTPVRMGKNCALSVLSTQDLGQDLPAGGLHISLLKRAPLSMSFRLLDCNDQVGTGETPEAEFRVNCQGNENIMAMTGSLI